MRRRTVVLAGLGLAAAGVAALRPRPEGAPYSAYFAALNVLLKAEGPMQPSLVVDLDRLDANIDAVARNMGNGKALRLVEKSLPALGLLGYIMARAKTRRLMSFHLPFMQADTRAFPDADILLGKPMPVAAAARFYAEHQGAFDPAEQLQWLIDTPERAMQYLALAKRLGVRMRLNLEIDVGLHRGGIADTRALHTVLDLIAQNPQHLRFAGFMGYDPHVVKVPSVIASRSRLLADVLRQYQAMADYSRQHFAALWDARVVLNTAGSPTYVLHRDERVSNELALGSGLVKPVDFDIDTLAAHQPAAFIATPVLKATGPLTLPGLHGASAVFSWWDPNQRQTFFIYGGNWPARYESPTGLRRDGKFGVSSNQENATASAGVRLAPDDHVFLRPLQSEGVFLQFGDVLAIRGQRIEARWPVLPGGVA